MVDAEMQTKFSFCRWCSIVATGCYLAVAFCLFFCVGSHLVFFCALLVAVGEQGGWF
jgi:hypothetical protein